MNRLLGLLPRGSRSTPSASSSIGNVRATSRSIIFGGAGCHQQQWQAGPKRGLFVRVYNGNVEQALQSLKRKMRDSGMESLIRKKAYFNRWPCEHHVKPSTRRYVQRRNIQYRIRNQHLFRTLRTLLAKKLSGH